MLGIAARIERVREWLDQFDDRAAKLGASLPLSGRLAGHGELVALTIGFLVAIVPIFMTRDLPFIDLPTHLATVHAWSNFDDPSWGFQEHYETHVKPVPYWGYYGFLKYASLALPIRWANKLYVILCFAGMLYGMAALLRAHGRPPILALGSVVIFWNFPLWYGFLSNVGGLALLFPAFLMMLRFSQAEGRARMKWAAANAAMGVLILFFHPLALFLWLVGACAYLWGRQLVVALPSLIAFMMMGGGVTSAKNHIITIQGLWRTPGESLKKFVDDYVFAFVPVTWNGWLFAMIGISIALAWLMTKPVASEERDRRPWRVLLFFTLAFLALPLHLQKPLGFAVVNPRVAVVVVLGALLCVSQGRLRAWRGAVVVLPICIAIAVLSVTLSMRFRAFDGRTQDFYACVDKLPRNPKVLTLIYDASDPALRGNVWRKYASYVMVEKGGYNPLLWDSSQGIGRLKFPLGYKGPRPKAPSADNARSFSWQKHGGQYDFFLTRREPANVFSKRPGLRLEAEHGQWRLWAVDRGR